VAGILAGDSVIFGLGHLFGQSFLSSRPMRIFLSPKRQERVGRFFRRHDKKAVFLARFVAGIRIGVYAYAGALRTSWVRFLFLDFLGAMLSGPTSIWVGKWAATKFAADRHEAIARAEAIMHEAGHLVLLGIAGVVLVYVVLKWSRYTRERRAARRQERSSARATAPPEREHSPPPKAN
jgi:membrane protein DedA with SNARE-associated domain